MFKAASSLPKKLPIANVKKTVVVASGKGGVGKSTVAANLAVSLSQKGKRIGILDADIFGPSIPRLFNLSGKAEVSENGKLVPKYNFGIQVMSMGFLIEAKSAIVWRGLMVMKAIEQLVKQVEWNDLDVLVIDMPPGTGDTQLSISQLVELNGAIIVSTPQDIALIDALKGIDMFRQVNVPVFFALIFYILGAIQNMSYFQCLNCKEKHFIFGSNGMKKLSDELNIELLGDIPLNSKICELSDNGTPIALSNDAIYSEIASKVLSKLFL